MPPLRSLLTMFTDRRMLLMLCLGFTSGLPFLLVGGTLSVWLKDAGAKIEDIGLFSLMGIAYSLKFFWAPLLDRHAFPGLSRLGRRRSWLLVSQALLAATLGAMAWLGPAPGLLPWFAALTALAAFAGATQDVAIDAWRIEMADTSAQGALAATQTLGYRLALLFSGAFALFLADHLPWSSVYGLMAATALSMMIPVWLGREPAVTVHEPASLTRMLVDPFRDFMTRYPGTTGALLLAFIGLFKMSDQMLGVMALPYYLDCGFSKTEIAAVSKLFGVWIGIAGAFLGGASVRYLGVHRSLVAAIIVGAASNLLYPLLQLFPGSLPVFIAVIGGENLSGGFLGTAAVAFLSLLVNRQYSATQYALLSSVVTLPGKLLGGFSGFAVAAIGYPLFFIGSAVSALPALLLFWWLRRRKALASEASP
jgi:PAT family beta-lactamase induction signal transducer AmpG